ncbi:Xanthine and CO dehydrogenases maturation factor, XdhC/CoxF family [uncultured delta proteobacterium]|uniref:Xanthine and CO dehydrogenases maturation factor, XdhC/CoxF family n=1 Tax=uncultured delta proteobacterium TaxID=34034 RepID=A0A212JBV4_9DELT|nr:Xanthine and CO dehydrogenases maturation factor, XdhC/CoxF family [uncultured delta proteobacterium]
MLHLLTVLRERLGKGQPLALATVVARKGSAPRGRGARLLADASGLIHGTVGGGAAEAAVLEACAGVLRSGGSRLLDLALTNAMAAQEGMACGGEVRVFVECVSPDAKTRDFFAALAAAFHHAALHDGGGVLLTRLAPGQGGSPERTLYTQGCFTGAPLGERAEKAFLAALSPRGDLSESAEHSLDGELFFAEPLVPPSRMLIAGAGHVAVPTAELAAFAGFSVHVIDDRPEFSRPERFPRADATHTAPDFADCLAGFTPDARTYVVIITRGHMHDGTVLAQALRTQAGYIGMIGSRKKRETVYAAMRELGFTEADLARIHCPVGLPIGAETPEEIAVSIVAECIAHKRGKLA